MKKFIGCVLGSLALAVTMPAPAVAWDGTKVGKISNIEITAGTNFGFRVWIEDATPICANRPWAYMNTTWDNYQAMASLLISAWLSERKVTVYTNNVNGYCEIGHVTTN